MIRSRIASFDVINTPSLSSVFDQGSPHFIGLKFTNKSIYNIPFMCQCVVVLNFSVTQYVRICLIKCFINFLTCSKSKFPTTYIANFALVKATFKRFSSDKNPIPVLLFVFVDFDRTHDIIITSLSEPYWNFKKMLSF